MSEHTLAIIKPDAVKKMRSAILSPAMIQPV